MTTLLAYRPFIDPLNLHHVWFLLLVPLALFVSIAYKAVRVHDMSRYWQGVAIMTGQIVLGMLALGAAFYLLIEWIVPIIAPMHT